MRVLVLPWLFHLPWFRRFDGYAAWPLILLRRPIAAFSDGEDLLCHELCHVWQMQHRPLRMPLSYLRAGYAGNPYEAQARAAVDATRAQRQRTSSASSAFEKENPGRTPPSSA